MTTTHTHPSTFLRRVLAADAAVSGGAGLLMIAAPSTLAGLLGLPEALIRGAGLSLIPFAALLLVVLRRDRIAPAAVWFIVACNVLWAVDSVALLLTGWVGPTLPGQMFVVLQALVVAALAEAQYVGLRRLTA